MNMKSILNPFVAFYKSRAFTIVVMIVVIILISFPVTKCSGFVMEGYNAEQANVAIRKANGGVIPGEEVMGEDGFRTPIRRYTFPTYTVICLGGRSGGCFVEPESR